jgi:hypothetical protein
MGNLLLIAFIISRFKVSELYLCNNNLFSVSNLNSKKPAGAEMLSVPSQILLPQQPFH